MDASRYVAAETLLDGRQLTVRALCADDRSDLLDAVGRMSDESRYFRFFGPRRSFTEGEIARFTELDFVNHVGIVAVIEDAEPPLIVAGARYIVSDPGRAEIAFAVDDAHQGLGIGTLLMRHLFALAAQAGLDELYAEVLSQNARMLKVFERYGTAVTTSREREVIHVSIRLH